MKIKDGYMLRSVAGQQVVLPVGQNMDIDVMITLNDTGAFLWKCLETETTQAQLVDAVLAEYDISAEDADRYITAFVKNLESHGFLECNA